GTILLEAAKEGSTPGVLKEGVDVSVRGLPKLLPGGHQVPGRQPPEADVVMALTLPPQGCAGSSQELLVGPLAAVVGDQGVAPGSQLGGGPADRASQRPGEVVCCGVVPEQPRGCREQQGRVEGHIARLRPPG